MQRWSFVLVGLVTMLEATNAHAFCRKTTCKDCLPDAHGCVTDGQPLFWPGRCTSFALTRQASLQVDETTAATIAARAFQAWQSVSCPDTGAPPSISVAEDFGPTSCTLTEYTHTGANANAIAFRDGVWPYAAEEDSAIGLTMVSFDSINGQIVDADVEINGTLPLSVAEQITPGQREFDLLSVLTHEAGHFLGLGHSDAPDSVMRPSYDPATDSLRELSDDDIAGICTIYPPDRKALACNFTPKGGFANECPLSLYEGGCSFARGKLPRGAGELATLLVVFSVARRRALRQRQRQRQRRAFAQGTPVRGRE